jgi:hypothetical protein
MSYVADPDDGAEFDWAGWCAVEQASAEAVRMEEARWTNQVARRALDRLSAADVNPSEQLGVALEHSIEDPFTGEITVSVQLDG